MAAPSVVFGRSVESPVAHKNTHTERGHDKKMELCSHLDRTSGGVVGVKLREVHSDGTQEAALRQYALLGVKVGPRALVAILLYIYEEQT